MKTQKGFTIIELMITVAIVGILAAIAIPAFANYTIRAQVAEGLTLVKPIKYKYFEYFAVTGNIIDLFNPAPVFNSNQDFLNWVHASGSKNIVSSGTYTNITVDLTKNIVVNFTNNANSVLHNATLHFIPTPIWSESICLGPECQDGYFPGVIQNIEFRCVAQNMPVHLVPDFCVQL